MSKETSIGRGPAHGSNENNDGDARHTTDPIRTWQGQRKLQRLRSAELLSVASYATRRRPCSE